MQDQYLAYMLRLWRVDDELTWRASLEDPRTNERYGFADLPALFVYLESLTDSPIAEEGRPYAAGEAGTGTRPQGGRERG